MTGGAGFIGSHVVDLLQSDGAQVIVLDDLSSGLVDNLQSRTWLEEGQINDVNLVQRLVDKVDGVFHLAAISSVQASEKDQRATHRVNFEGSMTVLRAIVESHQSYAPPLVFSSTAAVYGDQKDMPIKESAPKRPLSNYGKDKLKVEIEIKKAAHSHNLPALIFRPFNVYGPRQRKTSPYSGVISIFEHQFKNRAPVTIFGSGAQLRDFIYVEDVARRFIKAMEIASAAVPTTNLCTGQGTTLLELTDEISKIFGYSVGLKFTSSRERDIFQSIGDPGNCDRLLKSIDYCALSAGLKKTINISDL